MRGAFPLGDMRGANVDGVGQVSVQAISECPRLIRPADLKSEENYKILHLYISYTYWGVILYVADPVKCQPYKCVKMHQEFNK